MYLFLGEVKNYQHCEWADSFTNSVLVNHNNFIINWMPIEVHGIRYQDKKDENPTYSNISKYFNIYDITFDFIHKSKVNLIVYKIRIYQR